MPDSHNQKHCLLCGSSQIRLKESVAADLLVQSYAKAYHVNVESYFKATASRVSLIACDDCGLLAYDPMPAGDAAFYEALQQLPWYYQEIKPEYHFAKTHVRAKDRVLEVGCGKGVFRSFLADSVDYSGLEFNHLAIKKATGAGLHVTPEPIEQHAETHAGQYDVVCHFQVLEHVSNPRSFLEACAKVIKPGGKLIVAVPAEDSFLSLCENGWLNMPPHHVTRWQDRTLRFALESQLGFRVEEVWHEPVADYHKDWHEGILVNHAAKHLMARRTALSASPTLFDRVAGRASSYQPIRRWLLDSAKQKFPFAARGHTVCAVSSNMRSGQELAGL